MLAANSQFARHEIIERQKQPPLGLSVQIHTAPDAGPGTTLHYQARTRPQFTHERAGIASP